MNKFIHKVTVWERGGLDPMGVPSFSRLGVLNARWEGRDSVLITSDGREERSDTTIYFDRLIPTGSLVKRGEHADSQPPQDAREVRSSRSIDNIFGTQTEYRVQL